MQIEVKLFNNLRSSPFPFPIDFGKYGNILDRIEELADEEVRPVDLQVIYILKKGLE